MLSRPSTASVAAISRGQICEAAEVEDEADVYELSLHNTGLHSMLGLTRCVRLRVLDLSFNHLIAIEGLDALGDLRELKLYANEIAHVRGLEGTPKLQTLLLHDNRLGPECNPGGGGLLPLAQLTTLRVDTNPRLGAAGLADLHLEHLPALTELDASATRLGDAAALAGLRAAPVETLRLEHNELRELTPLACLASLRELHLAHNDLRASALAALAPLSALATLHLSANRIESLEQLPRLPSLVELHLADLADLPPLFTEREWRQRHTAAFCKYVNKITTGSETTFVAF